MPHKRQDSLFSWRCPSRKKSQASTSWSFDLSWLSSSKSCKMPDIGLIPILLSALVLQTVSCDCSDLSPFLWRQAVLSTCISFLRRIIICYSVQEHGARRTAYDIICNAWHSVMVENCSNRLIRLDLSFCTPTTLHNHPCNFVGTLRQNIELGHNLH